MVEWRASMVDLTRTDPPASPRARIVGVARGDGYDPRSVSGTPVALFDALARRYHLEDRIDVDLTPWQRWPVRLFAAYPTMDKWRARYVHSPFGFLIASRNSARILRHQPVNAVAVQVYGMFRTRGTPFVMFVDSTDEMAHRHWRPWSPYGVAGRTAWQALERRTYRGADHIFATSTVTADSVVTHYGVAPERVSVVGGGSNFFPLPPPRKRARSPEILFVGREWERKGGPELLQAFAQVQHEIPQARLVIAGVSDLRSAPGVEITGTLDRQQLVERFEAASVFCMPSRFDPFPNSLMEAMAYSLPCVSTTTAGIPELVLHGETGLLVESGDVDGLARALVRLLSEPQLADSLGRAGRTRVEEELTWDRVVDRMQPVLERMGLTPLSA